MRRGECLSKRRTPKPRLRVRQEPFRVDDDEIRHPRLRERARQDPIPSCDVQHRRVRVVVHQHFAEKSVLQEERAQLVHFPNAAATHIVGHRRGLYALPPMILIITGCAGLRANDAS